MVVRNLSMSRMDCIQKKRKGLAGGLLVWQFFVILDMSSCVVPRFSFSLLPLNPYVILLKRKSGGGTSRENT